MDRIKTVKSVIYRREPAPKFLLFKVPGKERWGFLTGRMKEGEEEKEAAIREMAEKAGIPARGIRDFSRTDVKDSFSVGGADLESPVFAVEINGNVRIDTNKDPGRLRYRDFEWLSPDEVRERLSFSNQVMLFEQVLSEVQNS